MARRIGARASAIVAALWLLSLPGCGGGEDLKEVNFGNGVFTFRIPSSWTAMPGADGSVTYRSSGPDRASLTVTTEKERVHWNVSANHLKSQLGKEANLTYGGARSYLTLNGNALVSVGKRFVEDGKVVYRHLWKHAVPIPPEFARFTTFVYEVDGDLADDDSTQQLLNTLEREIADSKFSDRQQL